MWKRTHPQSGGPAQLQRGKPGIPQLSAPPAAPSAAPASTLLSVASARTAPATAPPRARSSGVSRQPARVAVAARAMRKVETRIMLGLLVGFLSNKHSALPLLGKMKNAVLRGVPPEGGAKGPARPWAGRAGTSGKGISGTSVYRQGKRHELYFATDMLAWQSRCCGAARLRQKLAQ